MTIEYDPETHSYSHDECECDLVVEELFKLNQEFGDSIHEPRYELYCSRCELLVGTISTYQYILLTGSYDVVSLDI